FSVLNYRLMGIFVFTFIRETKNISRVAMWQKLKKNYLWEGKQMIKEILKRSLVGIAFGGIATFIALTIIKFSHIEQSAAEVWNHMLASMLLGVYFGIASLIYETDKWNPLKKTIIHFGLSISAYFLIALPVGWIPFTALSVGVGI